MAILVDRDTRVIFQGLTGATATRMAERAIASGTQVVGGVTPGKGGGRHLNLPVFDSVAEAAAATRPDASAVFVPPAAAASAMIEAIEAEVPLVVCVTERVPVLDMVRVRDALREQQDPPDRPELLRHHHAGGLPDRGHARPAAYAGLHRHRLALRHPGLRGRRPDHALPARPVDLGGDRGRPSSRARLRRLPGALPRGPQDQGCRADRRDRRTGGAGRGGLPRRVQARQADRRLRRRPPRPRRSGGWAMPARSICWDREMPGTRSALWSRPA